jgi:ubiquinone/menaquinone biosynthesis C-methylase UbiE
LLDHLDVSYAFLSPARQQASSKRHISFENEKLGCIGASFDKAICCMALHPLAPSRKLALLRELRRVLRQGGKVYIADFDQPYSKRETIALRGTGTLFGTESANIHHEGTMAAQIKLAGFTHIKRVYNEPDLIGRVSILEARR